MDAELKPAVGELRFKLSITRAATGKVEEFDMVGHITKEQAQEMGLQESENVGNTLDRGA